jgi:NADH dehydrogenase
MTGCVKEGKCQYNIRPHARPTGSNPLPAAGATPAEGYSSMDTRHRVVIVGGGFGGLYAAQALRKAPVEVTLVDRRNFHLFQPLLYQVATGALSPANIAAPLRAVLRKQRNTTVLLGEVVDFDLAGREVVLADGRLGYDSLLVASGARHHYFGHPEWEPAAPGLKTIEDATTIRRRVLSAFEQAERVDNPARQQALLTFVIVGGGPTGVELAGTIAEMAHHTLRGNFRRINPASAKVNLLEAADRILLNYPPELSAKAERSLTKLGVTVRTGTTVTDVHPEQVSIRVGDHVTVLPTHTVLWGAGVQASPLAAKLAKAAGAELDRAGRVLVGPDCTLPGHPEVFVLGDMTSFLHQTGKPLPGVAPVAMQMGTYAALTIQRRLAGQPPIGPFHYRDRGNLATIGRAAAVADLGWLRLSGYPAWLVWLFVHILYLIAFDNRVMVMFQWAWNYFTRGRSARLITAEPGKENTSC